MLLTFLEIVENTWRSCQEVFFLEKPVQSIHNDHLEPTYSHTFFPSFLILLIAVDTYKMSAPSASEYLHSENPEKKE